MEEAFLFALGFRRVGRRLDPFDAEGGARRTELDGRIDLSIVYIDGLRDTPAQESHLEHSLHPRERFVEKEFGVWHQATMVVKKAEEMGPAFAPRHLGIR